MTNLRAWLRKDATAYLSLIFISIVLARLLQTYWPQAAFFKGQNPATTFQMVVIPCILLVWVMYRGESGSRIHLNWMMFALVANFFYHFSLGAIRGEAWNYIALLMPVAILLVWIKPPTFRAVVTSTNVFCLALVGIAAFYQFSVFMGFVEARAYVEHRYFGLAGVDALRWRWEGPFGYVSLSGAVGTFLFVYGLTRARWLRVVLLSSGAVFLIASESRGAFIGAAVGLFAWLICLERLFGRLWSRRSKFMIGAAAILAVSSGVVLLDPTLNGRTQIWTDYLQLWTDSPWLGIDQIRLRLALDSGDAIFSAESGHSLFIDTLARSGGVGLALTLFVIAIVLVLVWKAYRRGMATGFVIALAFIAGCLTESLTSWIYLSIFLVPMVIAGLLAATWLRERDSLTQGGTSRVFEKASPSGFEPLP